MSTTLIVAGVVYFTAQNSAQSQISSRQVSAPEFSSDTPHVTQARLAKAPVQVELPAPPPTRVVPGLEEVLIATGDVTEQENKDLDAALKAFHDAPANTGAAGDYSDYAKPLLAFIAAHPQSNWNAALHTNLGLGYYRAGYFSRAMASFENAWKLGRDATSPQMRLIIDRAAGELAGMHARLGHEKELDAFLKDVGNRPIGGPATELFSGARGGLVNFRQQPEISFLCGPAALKNVLLTLKASPKQIKVTEDARSGPHGFSLPQLAALADKAKLKYTLIHREPGQQIPVPSIVNWNLHHYAAITGMEDRFYRVIDPTFASRGVGMLTQKALDAETTGYFLVPNTVMAANPKAGWRVVSAASDEAKAVYGMGTAPGTQPGACMQGGCSADNSSPNSGDLGSGENGKIVLPMTVASAMMMTVDLHLSDTPVGYRPQVGMPAYTQINYNARDDVQPATFGFSNLSPKWNHSWQSYIQDNPSGVTNIVRIAAGGGGYTNFYSNNVYPPEPQDSSQTVRVPASGTPVTSYTRTMPDGTKEVYGLSNGATTAPRYFFMTSVTDPQGNTTTLNYDSTFRLTSVVDAMGRSTTFTYGLTSYPLLVTKVTDPFGRFSQFTYDASQRLASITDPVGITSSFTYSTTEPSFVNQLTTPYGNSTFNDTINPTDPVEPATRSLTLTDPLGYTEYLYFYQSNAATPNADPAATVPSLYGIANNNMGQRNTFYWNKHAAALGATFLSGVPQTQDFTKGTIYHWFHFQQPGAQSLNAANQLSSLKYPLENRIWYNYPSTYAGYWSGQTDAPQGVARVLDSGATQKWETNFQSGPYYIASPYPVLQYDPVGRHTNHTYATNKIDLLTTQQQIGASYTTIATWGSYNTQHEPQTYTGPDSKTWNYTYNTLGQIKTITDPNSGVTTYNYDASNRLSTVQNANLVTALTLTYDSADRIRTRTDDQGYTLTYDYDNNDRITKITYPDATTDLYDYNFQSGPYVGTPSLEMRKHTDRLGRVTTYGFDADRRLTSVTEPTSGSSTRTTTYDYYEDGTLKNLTDADGNVTHWDIDIESRPTAKTYAYGTALAKTETYTYETTTSRLKSITDANGQTKTFTYANDDRVTGITYTGSINPTPNVTFTWDPYFPRLTKMVDGLGTTNYSYTALATNGALKLSSIDGPYANDVIGLTYDAMGRLAGRNITGGNETFGYDAISRLTSHVTPLGSFTETYLGQTAQQLTQSVTNGAVTVSTGWGYDTNANDRRLISITNSGVTRSYTLGYGTTPVNPYDIMSITDTAAATHPWATQSRAYTYDKVDRLLTASSTTPGNNTYAYDNLDNATMVTNPSGTITPAPTYNANNQLATWASNSYAYDSNGNTLSGDGTKTYKWDAENRLAEIDYVGSTAKSQFSYDGIGHRTVDTETSGTGVVTTTRYLWCGDTVCQARDGSDTVFKRDLLEGEYNFSTGQKLVYIPDQLGSVRDVLDATTGNLVQSFDYTPYGAIARSNGSIPIDYRYAGLLYHPASGLNLATYRAQDGVTGKWINRDPIREAGGINLYSYAGATPVGNIDTDGLCGTADPDNEKCREMLADMLNDVNAVRGSNAPSDPKGLAQRFRQLPTMSPNARPGHIEQFQGRQANLRKTIQDFIDEGCGNPPAILTDWANKEVPTFSPAPNSTSPLPISPRFPWWAPFVPPLMRALPWLLRI